MRQNGGPWRCPMPLVREMTRQDVTDDSDVTDADLEEDAVRKDDATIGEIREDYGPDSE